MRNVMTVDVEDYFQVSALEERIAKEQWTSFQPRVENNTQKLLEMFDRSNVKATFFVLGWIAARFPALIRRIADKGHEVASHGPMHERISNQSPEQFRQGVIETKQRLEDVTGARVNGYRAPSFSLGPQQTWAWNILAETGHSYSSSVYPGQLDHYGFPGIGRTAFTVEGTGLLEIPVTTLAIAGRRLPIGGGGYFRLYPYWAFAAGIRYLNVREQMPAMFYLHPWEIDPDQPRVAGLSAKTRFRHYLNLHKTERRLERLLGDFQWGRITDVYDIKNQRPLDRPAAVSLQPSYLRD